MCQCALPAPRLEVRMICNEQQDHPGLDAALVRRVASVLTMQVSLLKISIFSSSQLPRSFGHRDGRASSLILSVSRSLVFYSGSCAVSRAAAELLSNLTPGLEVVSIVFRAVLLALWGNSALRLLDGAGRGIGCSGSGLLHWYHGSPGYPDDVVAARKTVGQPPGWPSLSHGSKHGLAIMRYGRYGAIKEAWCRQETEIPQSQDPTHPHVAEERHIVVDVPDSMVPKKVKKMETVLKRRHVVLTDSEDEDAENSSKQGRNLQEEGLDEMVRSTMKEKSEEFETPT
ncbi:hypothetical protein Tco_0689669 [Tanacetum coccineum]